MNIFKLLYFYVKHNIKTIILFSMFSVIFTVVFYLYTLPTEAVLYSVLLCFCLGIIFVIFDFSRYCKKHILLREQVDRITLSIDELPVTNNLLEQDYQKLIETIHADKVLSTSNYDNEKRDMVEYYTLWAHQIKTPIAAMRLLLQTEENEQYSALSAELFKIEQYVGMVLQYLRLESSSTDYLIKKYGLDDIIKQAVRKYAKVFISKKISLDYSEMNFQVLTDEKWLVFVVEQILSNALKYTNEGRICIRLENKTLIIEDTGIGISEEDLPRVFENGFTGYNGRIDKKSTGIGLYLCKRILNKLSHTITIESIVGRGTTVKILLDSTIKKYD